MKVFKQRHSLLQLVAVPVLGILLLLPFVFLNGALRQNIEKEEAYLEASARERLLLAATDFQRDLMPEYFIENAFRAMNSAFGLEENDRNVYEDETIPKLIDEHFIASASAFLKANFGFAPVIAIAANADLEHSHSMFPADFFENEVERHNFIEGGILSIAFCESNLRNISPITPDVNQRSSVLLEALGVSNEHQAFSTVYKKYVSNFSNPPAYPDQCLKVFSTKFGRQCLYNFSYRFVRGFSDESEGLYGVYLMIIKSSQISAGKILQASLRPISGGIERKFVNRAVKKPQFVSTGEGLYFVANFPSGIYQVIDDVNTAKRGKNNRLRPYLNNRAIATFIPAADIKSERRPLMKMLSFFIRLTVLAIFSLTIMALLNFSGPALPMGIKLKSAVAILVFMPILGIFFAGQLIQSSSETMEMIRIQSLIQAKFNELEVLAYDGRVRNSVKFLMRKKIDAPVFAAKEPDLAGAREILKAQHNDSAGNYGQLLRFDGTGFTFGSNLNISTKPRKLERVGIFQIINELGFADSRAAEIKKLQKEQFLVGTYGDSLWQANATADQMSREGEVIGNVFSFTPLRKMIFHLLSLKEAPRQPFGFFLHEANEVRTLRKLLRFFASENSIRSTVALENGTVEFAAFARYTFDLRKPTWPPHIQGNNALRQTGLNAMQQKTSGLSFKHEGDEMVVSGWFYKEDMPFVLSAIARVKNKSRSDFLLGLIPWLAFLYGILATIIIADGLSAFFLNPLQILLKGVAHIRDGKLGLNMQIPSGDEFSELATSFNSMTTGLLQRAKMRRFVSDKLIENINAETETDESLSRVANICVLSSDVRNFTSISEENEPEAVVSILNDYLSTMEEAITANGGAIDKIVGDAILASFSSGTDREKAINACNASYAMRRRLALLNQKRRGHGLFCIENGVGLSFGAIATGRAGNHSRRKEFLMIGRAIQESEKLESMSKSGTESKIIIDENVRNLIGETFAIKELMIDESAVAAWELKNEA